MSEHVDRRADQVLGTQGHAGLADREDLGVGGRIVGLRNLIGALGQDLAVFDNDSGERPAAFLHVAPGDVDGSLNEVHGAPMQVVDSLRPNQTAVVAGSASWGHFSFAPR
jgi:hypothetical protein